MASPEYCSPASRIINFHLPFLSSAIFFPYPQQLTSPSILTSPSQYVYWPFSFINYPPPTPLTSSMPNALPLCTDSLSFWSEPTSLSIPTSLPVHRLLTSLPLHASSPSPLNYIHSPYKTAPFLSILNTQCPSLLITLFLPHQYAPLHPYKLFSPSIPSLLPLHAISPLPSPLAMYIQRSSPFINNTPAHPTLLT